MYVCGVFRMTEKKSEMRALRRLLKQHYGRRRPSADEILAVMKEYKIKDKKGKKK